ncbi:hypothetical protein ACW4YW_13980 [Methylobacillus pratensis]
MKTWILLSIPFLLSGCLYGQCLDGPCALEREKMIKSIKPYISYWIKEGMTEEGRLNDWVKCGGMRNGSFGINSVDRLSGESMAEATTRQEFAFQRCMIYSAYRYTGDCSSEYMKARPLCGAP